jgi:hypothetical protein
MSELSLFAVLAYMQPDRPFSCSGDQNDPTNFIAHDGGLLPTVAEIEAFRGEAEADAAAVSAAVDGRAAARSALRQQWDSLPPFIRGAYRPEFAAVNEMLDEGDDEAAAALIEFADAKSGFSPEQQVLFDGLKGQFAQAIRSIPGGRS